MYVSPPVSSSLREEAPATRISLKIGIIVVMSVLKKAENEFCNRNIDFWIPKAGLPRATMDPEAKIQFGSPSRIP